MTEELLEICDENDQVVGRGRRQSIHQSGLWHRGVHVFLFTPERKLLVQKRSISKAESPSALDCSVSEHIKPRESYFEGAIRGLREELGLKPITLKYIMKFKMIYGPGDNHISTVYEGTTDGQITSIDSKEIDHIDYYSISELEQLLIRGRTTFSNWFKQLLFWYLDRPSQVRVIEENLEL